MKTSCLISYTSRRPSFDLCHYFSPQSREWSKDRYPRDSYRRAISYFVQVLFQAGEQHGADNPHIDVMGLAIGVLQFAMMLLLNVMRKVHLQPA